MNIGFDLDKVFINYPPFIPAYLIDKRYKLKENGELIYRFPKKPEQWLRITLHYPVFRPLIKKNVETLRNLDQQQNKLYLISSRFGFLKNRTETIMNKYSLTQYFDGIYFNYTNEQPHIFKNAVIKTLHLDMYIDDDLSILKYIAKYNKKIKLFWLNYKESKKISTNIYAIQNLSEVLSYS